MIHDSPRRAHHSYPGCGHHKGVVFVVDDDDDLRKSVEVILEDEGYLVLGARNGAEALCRMRGISGPSVALVDLVMPEMDGWQLVHAMKADANLAGIPIVTCSAHVLQAVATTQAHLTKPLTRAALLSVLRASLEE